MHYMLLAHTWMRNCLIPEVVELGTIDQSQFHQKGHMMKVHKHYKL